MHVVGNVWELDKMANRLSFGKVLKLIPRFSGVTEGLLITFENKFDFVISHVSEEIKPTLLSGIPTNWTGKAVRYREIGTWTKVHLRIIFGKTPSVTYIHCTITCMEKERVKCITVSFRPSTIKRLVDTGADESLIKLLSVKKTRNR